MTTTRPDWSWAEIHKRQRAYARGISAPDGKDRYGRNRVVPTLLNTLIHPEICITLVCENPRCCRSRDVPAEALIEALGDDATFQTIMDRMVCGACSHPIGSLRLVTAHKPIDWENRNPI